MKGYMSSHHSYPRSRQVLFGLLVANVIATIFHYVLEAALALALIGYVAWIQSRRIPLSA